MIDEQSELVRLPLKQAGVMNNESSSKFNKRAAQNLTIGTRKKIGTTRT